MSDHSERLRELARRHREANPEIYREYKVRRRLVEVRATPKWANLDAIRAWYTFAAVTPGVHVDHIVPLSDGGHPLDPANLRAAHGKRQPWGCPGNYGRGKRTAAPPITREW